MCVNFSHVVSPYLLLEKSFCRIYLSLNTLFASLILKLRRQKSQEEQNIFWVQINLIVSVSYYLLGHPTRRRPLLNLSAVRFKDLQKMSWQVLNESRYHYLLTLMTLMTRISTSSIRQVIRKWLWMIPFSKKYEIH